MCFIGVRAVGTLLIAGVALLVLAPAQAATPGLGRCASRGATVVARGGVAVVLKRGDRYTACLLSSGRRRPLHRGTRGFGERPAHIRISGAFVGYELPGDCFHICGVLRVVDLRNGVIESSEPGIGTLRRFVIDASGGAAWIRRGTSTELHKMDGAGEDSLDSGAVAASSLSIRGGRVHWRRDHSARSVRLHVRTACGRRNTFTVARSPQARVYRGDEALFGCIEADGRVTAMGDSPFDDFEYQGGGFVEVSGLFASVDHGYAGRGDDQVDLTVFDLSRGALVHEWRSELLSESSLSHVVLTPSGAVAWINSTNRDSKPGLEVRKSDADGEGLVLDSASGSAIDKHSLRLNGSTISWTHDDQVRTAELL